MCQREAKGRRKWSFFLLAWICGLFLIPVLAAAPSSKPHPRDVADQDTTSLMNQGQMDGSTDGTVSDDSRHGNSRHLRGHVMKQQHQQHPKKKHYHKHPHKHPNYSIIGKHVHQHGNAKQPNYHAAKKHQKHKFSPKPPKWHAYKNKAKHRKRHAHGTYGGNEALLANQLILSALPANRYQDQLYDRMDVYAREQNRVEQPRFQAQLQSRMARHWNTYQRLIQRASDQAFTSRIQSALYRNYPLYERFAERVNSPGFVEPLQLQLYTRLFGFTGESNQQHASEAQAVDAAYGAHVP